MRNDGRLPGSPLAVLSTSSRGPLIISSLTMVLVGHVVVLLGYCPAGAANVEST
jgi:hypothetical protein